MRDSNMNSNGDVQTLDAPSHEAINAQLERILSDAGFASSKRLQKLLRFIVGETLAGRSDLLKEYAIAIDVFDRDESFDPQTSSIVRVEASRLRAKLKKYNAIEGRDDPIRIELPAGSYIPSFESVKEIGASTEPPVNSTSSVVPKQPNFVRVATFFTVLVAAGAMIAFFVVDSSHRQSQPEVSVDSAALDPAFSIAVLPLRNFSGDPAEDYFSDGMTDALITGLAQRRVAYVTSMTSAMAYKDSNRPMSAIARELGVSHLIEGSVMRVGAKVRISVQLIEAQSDRHLWAESYERGMSDILRLQDEVVTRIVSSIAQHVTPEGAPTLMSVSVVDPADAVDPAAYEAHLKGRFFLNKVTEDGFNKGITYFKQSIEKAPDYAPSHSGIAACHCLLGGHGFELVKPSEGMPTAKKAVMEALRLDNNRAEPHAFLGIIRLKYDWDWRSAEESFARAIEINPSYSRAHIFYSFYLEAMGRHQEAVREAEAARALDPLSRATNINLGWQYLQAGNLIEAKRVFERTAEIHPDHWGVHWGMGQYHLRMSENEEAISAFQRANDAGGGHAMPLSALGYTYAITGHEKEAREVLGSLEALSRDSYVSPYHLATVYAGMGENDEAFALLDEAYNLRSRSMAWLNVAPEMDSLRSDPRFGALLQRIGLVEK